MGTTRVDTIDEAQGAALAALLENADSIIGSLMPGVTVAAETGSKEVYEHTVSDLQSDIVVEDGKITGTLHYISGGALPGYWGPGYFLVLKVSDIGEAVTSILVGLEPSEGSGLVEMYGDPDMNCAAKITNQNLQKFKVVTTDGSHTTVQKFDLSGLVFEPID